MNIPEFVEHSKAIVSNAGTLHKLASGGTANHLVLWDLRLHGLTKSNVEKVCEACLDDGVCISFDFVVEIPCKLSQFLLCGNVAENCAA